MTHQYDFDTSIDRTGTYCTQWDYVQDRFGKEGLLPFTISDMDFAAPNVVLDALKQRLEHPVLGYSRWNHHDFRSAVTAWFHRRFDAMFDEQAIVYGPSVIYIISSLIQQWSKPGQGVVYHAPGYDAFDRMIAGQQRVCVPSSLLKEHGQFSINWCELEQQLADPNNRIFLLCSPHNPTGRVWSKEELIRIAKLCQRHNVAVISDEIHMDIAFKPHTPWQGFGLEMPWALVSSASKSFNIPALTGAYAIIPDQQCRDDYLFKLKHVDGLSSPAILGVLATMAAYQKGHEWLDALNDYVLGNHKYVQTALNSAIPQINYQLPEATYLAWIDLSSLPLDMAALNRTLIDQYDVAIMQGSTYGDVGKDYVRLNLGCPRSKVEAGVAALIAAIQAQLTGE